MPHMALDELRHRAQDLTTWVTEQRSSAMAAYLIARIDVTDPDRYEEYKVLAADAVAKHAENLCNPSTILKI